MADIDQVSATGSSNDESINNLHAELRQQAEALMQATINGNVEETGCQQCRQDLAHIIEMTEHYPDDTLAMLDRWSARQRKRQLTHGCNNCPATRFRAWDLQDSGEKISA